MNRFKSIMTAAAGVVAAIILSSCCQDSSKIIKVPTPARPAGQEDALGLRTPALDTVRIGFVGVGNRGSSAVYRYTFMPWTRIVALCDYEPDRVQKNVDFLAEKGITGQATYTGPEGYRQLCERDDIDLVYICTDWKSHVPIALYALEHGKNVAIEVPAATSLEECWALIDSAERNRLHCMMLENSCYDFFELKALEMARENVFGEVLHVEGSYLHNLSENWARSWRFWRLDYNSEHKGDLYPTHGLGPIAQVLNIHRGDRFSTLVSMDTKSVNGVRSVKKFKGEDMPDFQNGDLTSTMIRTEHGKSVFIEHDVMTPRPYNRMYQIVGADGYASKYPVETFAFSEGKLSELGIDYDENFDTTEALEDSQAEQLKAKYQNPILDTDIEELAKRVGGHGGMDFLMDYRLIYCLHNGLPLDMDVYDLAEWSCISELSAISIANGCAPVEVPDFTRGAWDKVDGFKYAFADGSFR